MKYADLHLHSIFSDGTYTPRELIQAALKQGLDAIALVDHDAVEGIESTLDIARGQDIEVLPGIELTTEYDGLEIHILGYLIDYKDKGLLEKLNELKKNRVERIYKITSKLRDGGIDVRPETVLEIAAGGTPGRLHIARAMIKEGWVGSVSEAFQKYIGDKCPAYVAGFRLSPQEAIDLVKGVKGIPVLAHPYVISNDELIPQLVSNGLMGLEAYYPEHSQSQVNFYLDLAKKYSLLVTGGSDCHGDAKPEVRIGSIKIPYALVENLKLVKDKLL